MREYKLNCVNFPINCLNGFKINEKKFGFSRLDFGGVVLTR